MPKRLTCGETARALNLSEFTLAKMRRQNRGPAFIRVTRNRVEYLEDSVTAWLAARTVVPAEVQGAA